MYRGLGLGVGGEPAGSAAGGHPTGEHLGCLAVVPTRWSGVEQRTVGIPASRLFMSS